VDVLQSWLVVGVPGLVAVGVLFVGYSRTRALIGYVVLAALIAFFVTVPRDPASASALGFLLVVFVASGRGTAAEDRRA
jgi:hypothetical protein